MNLSRRDFLNGAALTIGAGLAPVEQLIASTSSDTHRSSFLGSTDASYRVAHALRDGASFSVKGLSSEGEVDLVVVGAGISGLAAAYYFRVAYPHSRILILDNNEDFGGHARRCEMHVDGRLILGYGGSESIQSPRGIWSESALALLRDLGVDLAQFEAAFDRDLYPNLGLSRGVLFKREHFGVDKLVTGDPTRMVDDDIAPNRMNARDAKEFISDFPLSANDREGRIALYEEIRDVLPGGSAKDKAAQLSKISYRDFLTRYWGLSDRAADTFQKRPHDFFALGIDAIAAIDAASTGYPGFQGLGLKMSEEENRLKAARQPIGRITIANSDSAGAAYAHAAIDEARRAVDELRGIV